MFTNINNESLLDENIPKESRNLFGKVRQNALTTKFEVNGLDMTCLEYETHYILSSNKKYNTFDYFTAAVLFFALYVIVNFCIVLVIASKNQIGVRTTKVRKMLQYIDELRKKEKIKIEKENEFAMGKFTRNIPRTKSNTLLLQDYEEKENSNFHSLMSTSVIDYQPELNDFKQYFDEFKALKNSNS